MRVSIRWMQILTVVVVYFSITIVSNLQNMTSLVFQQQDFSEEHRPPILDQEFPVLDQELPILDQEFPVLDQEFPYRLTCPGTDLKTPRERERNYTITLAYHVGMVKNWKSIVTDQMETLHRCGLGQAASDFILSYSNGDLEQLQDVVTSSKYKNKLFFGNSRGDEDPRVNATTSAAAATPKGRNSSQSNLMIVHSIKSPWEGAVMNQIFDHCRARQEILKNTAATRRMEKPTIVFYFHNKGASKWSEDWRDKIDQIWTYSRSLYWRKYMEYFLLERPELCIDKILHKGAGSCGIMYNSNHFSGNFWAASCDYISKLDPIDMTVEQGYTRAETWIGEKRGTEDGLRPYSLHENPSGEGLYRHLIEPHEYSDYHSKWTNHTLS